MKGIKFKNEKTESSKKWEENQNGQQRDSYKRLIMVTVLAEVLSRSETKEVVQTVP